MPTKPALKPDKVEEIVPVDGDPRPEGCEHCNDTGFEPGFGRSEAPWCSVCHGSPFVVKTI